MKINENWKLQWFEPGEKNSLELASPSYIDHYWMSVEVPGDVHSTLIDKKIIEDPFVGHNDLKCRWVEEKEWWYRTTIHFDAQVDPNEWLELTFEGLDTFATVYLNGLELGVTENMFLSHTFDVTREIKQGENVIAVKFDPISLSVSSKPHLEWSSFDPDRVWTRKAQMNYGWDWGPRLVTYGIWKDVYMEKKKYAKIDHVFARTQELESDHAILDIDVTIDHLRVHSGMEVEVTLSDGDQISQTKQTIQSNSLTLSLHVDQPKLWWTHDLGDPHLYKLEIKLLKDGSVIDCYLRPFGIRTIEVQQKDDNGTGLFVFVLNGVHLFAKGANWIPVDSFFGAARDSRYTRLIQLARKANMNMLRVWGGGIYEKDVFYEECDRQGLLVWQDFMFACAQYPDYNMNFMGNVRHEVIQVIQRLRNYACLALWCGNNENDWIYEMKVSSGEVTTPFYGEKIYHRLIPELLREMDPTRLYWPSSPYGGNDHDSAEEGDRHNWQVWHGNIEPRKFGEVPQQDYSVDGVSFKNYKKDTSTFSSEFGMHASSNRFTLENNIPDGSFYWKSDEMSYRNKDYHEPKGILLMEGYTGIPKHIEEYMNFSMLTQAEGLKCGIEHYRRRKPYTGGTLIWQLNDCWPGTSWSIIDYYLLPKASYYYARKFYNPVLLSMDYDPGQNLKVWVTNDRLESYKDTVYLDVLDFDGKKVFSRHFEVDIAANASEPVAELIESDVLNGYEANRVVVHLHSAENSVPGNVYFLRDHKDMRFSEVEIKVDVDKEQQSVTVSAEQFTRFVKIELPEKNIYLDDNFFDLLPGESRTISINRFDGQKANLDHLKVSAINERY